MYNFATDYFYNGAGQGSLNHTIPCVSIFVSARYSSSSINRFIHVEERSGKKLGQTSESGRDQGHATLDYALLGVIAQTAWNQGLDLFGYASNRILAG